MTTRKQMILAGVLILAAGGTVLVGTLLSGDDEAMPVTAADPHAGHGVGGAVAAGDEMGPVVLDDEAARRIGIAYAVAEMKPLAVGIQTVGNVGYDETRLTSVSPKVEGWVERLYVDFTGAAVRRGQPLLTLYSPMLVSAQEELILARRLVESAEGAPDGRAATNASELLAAVRRRLRYWDVSEAEIAQIERAGVPSRALTIVSPASGIVTEKNVVEGSRVMPGMDLYRLADLSTVWIEGEVFERDLARVRVGQGAIVSVDAYPGQAFPGRVSYVYPSVSVETRTGRVRIALDNPGGRLMPGMYATVALDAAAERSALMIPRDAVHVTGERSMVFVPDAAGALHARDITTGLVAADEIEVLAGLRAGERVVASANFLVDAESSMGGAGAMPGMEM